MIYKFICLKKKEEETMDAIQMMQTPIPQELKTLVESKTIYFWESEDSEAAFTMVFLGISNYLTNIKSSKDTGAVALRIDDDKGNMIMSAILRYKENKDKPEMPGNWNLSYTTKEEDLKDVAIVRYYNDVGYCKAVNNTCTKLYNWGIFAADFVSVLTQFVVMSALNVLDKNAVETGSYDIELKDIVMMSVEVIDGIKEFAFTPGTKSKQFVKNDGDIQK